MTTPDSLTELPRVVPVPDQPCQQLYEANPVLLGFDVVHYHQIPAFKDGGVARQGSPEFAYNFEGYQFWFVSQENRDLFVNDPWKYAPAWGGFCSFGIALERKPEWPWETDFLGPPASPWEGWAIINGTLTFNIWSAYTDRFLEDTETNMKLAAERWREMFDGKLRAGPFNTHCIGHGTLENWCLTQQPSPWLQPLPSCNETALATEDVSSVVGGGIVSDLDSFEDFNSRSNLSPYQRRWIGIGVAIGLLVVVGLVCCALVVSRSKKSAAGHVSKKSLPQESSQDEELSPARTPNKD